MSSAQRYLDNGTWCEPPSRIRAGTSSPSRPRSSSSSPPARKASSSAITTIPKRPLWTVGCTPATSAGKNLSPAAETGINPDEPGRPTDERLRSVISRDVESVNARYSPPERIRDLALVPEPFSAESGEPTPTLKIRRNVVARRHAVLYPAP